VVTAGQIAPVAPDATGLPLVFAGPMLRRVTRERLALWLAVREPCRLRWTLGLVARPLHTLTLEPGGPGCRLLHAGERLHYLLVDVALDAPLPTDEWIPYTIALQPVGGRGDNWHDWRDWAPDLCYENMASPGFVLPSRVGAVLHGSCRKPHHAGGDGLVRADQLLAELVARLRAADGASGRATAARTAWPSMLVMSGDQVYADDVAGPLLRAIHSVIPALRLPNEELRGLRADAPDARAVYRHPASYYRRQALLPSHRRNYALIETFFGGVEKPVFTTTNAHNHLITLSEVLVMYLLVWSPALWSRASMRPPDTLSARDRITYACEQTLIETFVEGLAAVRRLMAHIPVAMIFDDHDITDDWNLSREWEEIAYGHPFSRRVIGNALIAYLVNQAWGNRPDAFDDALLARVERVLREPGCDAHGPLIDDLLRFDQWHYRWPTEPPLIVIDSRTHRWRSESAARRPSGLMDWEALTDLQQSLRGERAVLLVSSAPIFGVKLIEVIQRVFTWFGHPLMVDAENWMSHPGAAHAILNIFGHRETPRNFVILSGDVHYSFVYDVALRRWDDGPDIWQISSSGLRNTFPDRLLEILDHLNRWLYAPRSPLNWLTRRRRMRVTPRKPIGTPHGRRLLNASGIGLVEIDDRGVPWRISQLLNDGRQVEFVPRDAESRWE
jgi:hypothetical protein